MPVANRVAPHWLGVSAKAPATLALLAVVAEPAVVAEVAVAALPVMLIGYGPRVVSTWVGPIFPCNCAAEGASTTSISGAWLLVVLSLLSSVMEMVEPEDPQAHEFEGMMAMPLLVAPFSQSFTA